MLDIDAIQELLPHRFPFLLVDRILEFEPGERAVGIKNVTANEPWCAGHFPGNSIFPGVLIAEALAQTAAIVYLTSLTEPQPGQLLYLVGMDGMKFRRPVRPGDTIRLEASAAEKNRRMWSFDTEASVDGRRVANGRMKATLPR